MLDEYLTLIKNKIINSRRIRFIWYSIVFISIYNFLVSQFVGKYFLLANLVAVVIIIYNFCKIDFNILDVAKRIDSDLEFKNHILTYCEIKNPKTKELIEKQVQEKLKLVDPKSFIKYRFNITDLILLLILPFLWYAVISESKSKIVSNNSAHKTKINKMLSELEIEKDLNKKISIIDKILGEIKKSELEPTANPSPSPEISPSPSPSPSPEVSPSPSATPESSPENSEKDKQEQKKDDKKEEKKSDKNNSDKGDSEEKQKESQDKKNGQEQKEQKSEDKQGSNKEEKKSKDKSQENKSEQEKQNNSGNSKKESNPEGKNPDPSKSNKDSKEKSDQQSEQPNEQGESKNDLKEKLEKMKKDLKKQLEDQKKKLGTGSDSPTGKEKEVPTPGQGNNLDELRNKAKFNEQKLNGKINKNAKIEGDLNLQKSDEVNEYQRQILEGDMTEQNFEEGSEVKMPLGYRDVIK